MLKALKAALRAAAAVISKIVLVPVALADGTVNYVLRAISAMSGSLPGAAADAEEDAVVAETAAAIAQPKAAAPEMFWTREGIVAGYARAMLDGSTPPGISKLDPSLQVWLGSLTADEFRIVSGMSQDRLRNHLDGKRSIVGLPSVEDVVAANATLQMYFDEVTADPVGSNVQDMQDNLEKSARERRAEFLRGYLRANPEAAEDEAVARWHDLDNRALAALAMERAAEMVSGHRPTVH